MPKDNHPPFTWVSLSNGANFPMWVSLSELWMSLSELANMGSLSLLVRDRCPYSLRVYPNFRDGCPYSRPSLFASPNPQWVSLIRSEWVAGAGAFMECEGTAHYSGGP